MSLVNKRIWHLFWVFFEKFGIVALSVVSFFVYAIYLTPTQMGIGALLLALVEFVSRFQLAVINSSMIRLPSITKEQDGTAFWLLMLSSIVSGGLILLAYFQYFTQPIVLLGAVIAVLVIPFNAASRVHIVHLRQKKKFKKLAQLIVVGKLCGIAVGISLAMKGFGELAIVSQASATAAISTVLILLTSWRALPFAFERKWCWEQLCIGVPASIKVVNESLFSKGTVIMLESLLGTAAVGFYNFANRLIELPRSAMVNAIMGYANPVFSQRKHRGQDIDSFFIQSTKISLVLFMPMFVGMAAVAPDILELIFKDKWLPSANILAGIAVLTAINFYFMFMPSLLLAYGKTKLALKGQIAASIAALVALFFTIESFGLVAIIYALGLRVLLLTVVNINALSKVIDGAYKKLFNAVFASTLASALMFGGIIFISTLAVNTTLLGLCIKVLVGMTIYGLSLLMFERDLLAQIKRFFTE